MNFPIYRKRTRSYYVEYVKICAPEITVKVTVFDFGDCEIERISTDHVTELQFNYREHSTEGEFRIKYQTAVAIIASSLEPTRNEGVETQYEIEEDK